MTSQGRSVERSRFQGPRLPLPGKMALGIAGKIRGFVGLAGMWCCACGLVALLVSRPQTSRSDCGLRPTRSSSRWPCPEGGGHRTVGRGQRHHRCRPLPNGVRVLPVPALPPQRAPPAAFPEVGGSAATFCCRTLLTPRCGRVWLLRGTVRL